MVYNRYEKNSVKNNNDDTFPILFLLLLLKGLKGLKGRIKTLFIPPDS
jgi:hypothetical protein